MPPKPQIRSSNLAGYFVLIMKKTDLKVPFLKKSNINCSVDFGNPVPGT